MHSTKTATIIEKVNCDEPIDRPPMRISTVCNAIAAKPASSAITANRPSRVGAVVGACVTPSAPRRTTPSRPNDTPATRLITPIARTTDSRPSHGIRTKAAASAPTKAPAVLHA